MVRMYNFPKQSNKNERKKLKEIIFYEVIFFLIFIITFILGNPMPTTKLAIQFTSTAIAMALGLGPCENNSAVIIQGIEPGPTAKKTTKPSVDTTDR